MSNIKKFNEMFTTGLTTEEMIQKVGNKLDQKLIDSYNELDEDQKNSPELKSTLANLLEDLEEMNIYHVKKWSTYYKDLINLLPNFSG